ncbi:MAG: DUF5041 domain-containing protein [Rikenellaceae bacterium]|nr:DUF5041 domain-containing protein [Rikenellaceae bacterium]
MKKLMFTLLPVFVIFTAPAQQSPRFTVSALFSEDVEWLLETENIHTYAVDLAPVKGEEYKLNIYIDEYRNGRDSVKQVFNQSYETRRSFTDGPTCQMERLRTFFKVQNDSLGQIGVSIPGFFSFRRPVDLYKRHYEIPRQAFCSVRI